jgi:hypothetical protein
MSRRSSRTWSQIGQGAPFFTIASFDKSLITMRYDAATEMEYVRYLYDGSLTLYACVVTSLLVAILFIAEAVSGDRNNVKTFLLSIGSIGSVTAFFALWVGRWCFSVQRCSVAPIGEAQRVGYVMECVAAASGTMSLCIAGYLSSFPLSAYRMLYTAYDSRSYNVTSINSLFVGVQILLASGTRPRCIFMIPAYGVSLVAAYCGSRWSGARGTWEAHGGDTDALHWNVLRDTQFAFAISLAIVCSAFRIVREWQHRRHFQQRHSMRVNQGRVELNGKELQRIIERFVPALDPAVGDGLVVHSNPKGVCGFIEIIHKDYMLPNSSKAVHNMAKLIARVEQTIRRHGEGGGIERIILDGDAFCCTAGLERVNDELGTRTLDVLKCLHSVISEAAKWNVPDLLRGMQGKVSQSLAMDMDESVNLPEESIPLELRGVLHTGPLLGSAIGRSTFQYSITGECVAVGQWMLALHPSSRHIAMSRPAVEACGGHVRVVPQHPIDIVLHGRRDVLPVFLLVRIEEGESHPDDCAHAEDATREKGPILDLLVTPPFDAATVEKESFSLLAELAGERSAFSGVHGSAEGLPSDSRPTREATAAHATETSRGFFSDALERDAAVSRQLAEDMERTAIRPRSVVGERFVFHEQETRFFRVRSSWQTPLRAVVLITLIVLIVARRQWSQIITHLCTQTRGVTTQLCIQEEVGDKDTDNSSLDFGLGAAEFVLWAILLVIYLLRTLALGHIQHYFRRLPRRRLLFFIRSLETLLLDAVLLLLAAHYYMKTSTLSRQWPSLMWILILCHYFSYVPLHISHFIGWMIVVLSIVFYSIIVQLWRPLDIVHFAVLVAFFGMMATAEERQDRRFFQDALIARASAVAQRKKQVILGGVLRATIPSILHTFHRSLLQMRPSGKTANGGTLVVMHEHLVIMQLLWRGGSASKNLFDRVSLVERCVQEGNELIDVLLRRNRRAPFGSGRGSESDSENDIPIDGGTSVGEHQTHRPSICVTCCLGDVVTVAGLPVTAQGQQGTQPLATGAQIAAIVASTIYVFERCTSLHKDAGLMLSGAISLGLGASLMSYEDDPKYSMGGLPLTQVTSVLRTVGTSTSGAFAGLWATTDAVSALGEMYPDEVLYLSSPDGRADFAVRVGASKRWRTRGVGAVDVHPISSM